MRFLAADDDFVLRTLKAIRGPFLQLVYVASLRGRDGAYRHWGFARSFGEQVADRTIRRKHQQTAAEVLRTPLARTWRDVEAAAATDPQLLERLSALHPETVSPSPMCRAEAEHLKMVLNVVQDLAASNSATA